MLSQKDLTPTKNESATAERATGTGKTVMCPKHTCKMLWTDLDTGAIYRIDESTGAQIRCDSLGVTKKPSNPRITGRFNYEERMAYAKKVDTTEIEIPTHAFKMPFRRVYAPQLQRLNGYAQMPRMLAPTYQNSKQFVTNDPVKLRRAERTNNAVLKLRYASLTPTAAPKSPQKIKKTRVDEVDDQEDEKQKSPQPKRASTFIRGETVAIDGSPNLQKNSVLAVDQDLSPDQPLKKSIDESGLDNQNHNASISSHAKHQQVSIHSQMEPLGSVTMPQASIVVPAHAHRSMLSGESSIVHDYVAPSAPAIAPLMSKWNQKQFETMTARQMTAKDKQSVLNKCVSHLVAPHNLTYDNRSMRVYDENKERVIDDCQRMIRRFDDKWAIKLRGMSTELQLNSPKNKPVEILRTEQLVKKLKSNSMGQTVHGRRMTQPDLKLYQTMLKRQQKTAHSTMSHRQKGASITDEDLGSEDMQSQTRDYISKSVMRQTGHVAGNRALFVTTRDRGFSGRTASLAPTVATEQLAAFQPKAAGRETNDDYYTIKARRTSQSRNTFNKKSLSITTTRMDREFTTDRPRMSTLFDQASKTSTQTASLIKDLTMHIESNHDLETALESEILPGSCKSQYAQTFQMKMDANAANFAARKPNIGPLKSKQKGKFPVDHQTAAFHWLQDREWAKKVNPALFQEYDRLEAADEKMLAKRKAQKTLQATAMEAQFKIKVKNPKF